MHRQAGQLRNQVFLTANRVELSFDMPLSEIVFDFYDRLKSISRGYASLDYHLSGYMPASLVKLDILLNGEKVDALSSLIHKGLLLRLRAEDVAKSSRSSSPASSSTSRSRRP